MMSAPTPLAQPAYEDPRPVLARLETLNAGPTRGATFTLRTPLAHVGRGAHNDVRLADESVSETHAKLQRREDGWYVVDMESTNGTYVAGTRIRGERRLEGSPDIRFGGIKMRFTSAETASLGAPATEPKGTRAIASVERPKRAPAAPERAAAPAPAASGRSALVWIVLLVVVAVVAFFVLQGRA
jgi:predicted component of type VI protein secretion system